MQGVSRTSLTEVIRRLDDILPSANTATLGHELFEVVALLDQEHSLRRWLADPAGSPDSKSELVNSLLETKVSPATLLVVSDVVRAQWSRPRDLVDAVEQAAVLATVAEHASARELEGVEDELFRFARSAQRR